MEDKKTSREQEIYKVTMIRSIVNFPLLVFKFVEGFMRHGTTLLAYTLYSLSDFVTDLVVTVFVRISNKPQDKDPWHILRLSLLSIN